MNYKSMVKEDIESIEKDFKCDKFDYLAAMGCGAIGGVIDVFLVGMPTDSKLINWTDIQTNKMVMNFAKFTGWRPEGNNEKNVASAIGFLERKFKINYDHRYTSDVSGYFNMNTKNHHLKSLGHQPDLLGLFFSILNQFTSTASFVNNGKIINVKTETFELIGSNFIAKIFCGVANWFGHIMSDIAGSSGSKGRGTGIAIPFYHLFQFCDFGKFQVNNHKQTLAVIAERAFKEGYDFRFGLTMTIPVLVTDLLIRLIWGLRRYFQYNLPLEKCISISSKNEDLRLMLIVGNGTLCFIDGGDAIIRGKGNYLLIFMHINLIAWFRFLSLILKDVSIRLGWTTDQLEKLIEEYRLTNEELVLYKNSLEKIDLEKFKKETQEYNKFLLNFEELDATNELNKLLNNIYEEFKIEKPWIGEFNEFMADKEKNLEFR